MQRKVTVVWPWLGKSDAVKMGIHGTVYLRQLRARSQVEEEMSGFTVSVAGVQNAVFPVGL